MGVELSEMWLGDLRWIVLRGTAREAFGSLGEHTRAQIREVVTDWEGLAQLRRLVARPPASDWLGAVTRASQARYPGVWAELAAMAAGANVPVADLALLNLRGDVGTSKPAAESDGPGGGEGAVGAGHTTRAVGGRAGGAGDAAGADGGRAGGVGGDNAGCSDLAWRRERSFLAHNEDDSGFFAGRNALLTLLLDSLQPVTAYWKAGFVPSNAFAVTGTGVVWGIDSLSVAAPGPGAGRHFVARGLQHAAATVQDVLGYLRDHPSAGGFSYTVGDRSGRLVIVESSAGQHGWQEVGGAHPLRWHTNHGIYVSGADVKPGDSSLSRGQTLASLPIPAAGPDPAWFARVLADTPAPAGVRVDPSPRDDTATLCTFVADLTAAEITVINRAAAPVTLSLTDLAEGRIDSAGVP
jgi:hypothetical protein